MAPEAVKFRVKIPLATSSYQNHLSRFTVTKADCTRIGFFHFCRLPLSAPGGFFIGGSKVSQFLKLDEVKSLTGLCRASIYRLKALETDRRFPKPINLGGRSNRWLRTEVDAWVQKLVDARDQAQK